MANESGTNQFAGLPEGPPIPYGDKQRQAALARLAPIAGGNVPDVRRASQDEPHPTAAAPAPGPTPELAPPVPAVPGPPVDQLYPAIAAIDGASPLVKEIFGGGS